MLTYLTIFGVSLLLISFFLKGALIQLALLGIWIAVIINAGSVLPVGSDRTWVQIVASLLMTYSVVMIVKRFFSSSGVD